jgi:hypothetical protein
MKKYTGANSESFDTLTIEERRAELAGARRSIVNYERKIEIIRKENKNLEDTIEKYADIKFSLRKEKNLINHIISFLEPILIQENYIFDKSGFPKKIEDIPVSNDIINLTENIYPYNPNNNSIYLGEGGSNSSNDELKEALVALEGKKQQTDWMRGTKDNLQYIANRTREEIATLLNEINYLLLKCIKFEAAILETGKYDLVPYKFPEELNDVLHHLHLPTVESVTNSNNINRNENLTSRNNYPLKPIVIKQWRQRQRQERGAHRASLSSPPKYLVANRSRPLTSSRGGKRIIKSKSKRNKSKKSKSKRNKSKKIKYKRNKSKKSKSKRNTSKKKKIY